MSDFDNYIKILNLGENFRNLSQEEQVRALAKAWRKFSLKWHPDRNKSPEAEKMFKIGNNANDMLKEYIKSGYFSSEEDENETVNNYSTDDTYQGTDYYYNENYYQTESEYNRNINSQFWEKYNNTQGQGKTLFLESSTPLKIIITALIISFVWFVIFEFKPIENTSSKTQQTTANHVTNTSGTSAEATNGKKTESKFKVNINDNEVKSENKLNDVNREPDFGPYMRELQRRIRMNWNPPKVSESKRVVVIFKVAKDGRLLSCSVYKSSGLPSADQAALDAIKATAPFKPLPVEYKNPSMDIQFTFDYNIPGAARY